MLLIRAFITSTRLSIVRETARFRDVSFPSNRNIRQREWTKKMVDPVRLKGGRYLKGRDALSTRLLSVTEK